MTVDTFVDAKWDSLRQTCAAYSLWAGIVLFIPEKVCSGLICDALVSLNQRYDQQINQTRHLEVIASQFFIETNKKTIQSIVCTRSHIIIIVNKNWKPGNKQKYNSVLTQ